MQVLAMLILLSGIGFVLHATAQNRADNDDGSCSIWRGPLVRQIMDGTGNASHPQRLKEQSPRT